MPLPDLIEIVPLEEPVQAEITVPGSKSITNRALVLAALADGEVTLEGALWSEDTQVMVECLQELGFMVNVAPDQNDTSFCSNKKNNFRMKSTWCTNRDKGICQARQPRSKGRYLKTF